MIEDKAQKPIESEETRAARWKAEAVSEWRKRHAYHKEWMRAKRAFQSRSIHSRHILRHTPIRETTHVSAPVCHPEPSHIFRWGDVGDYPECELAEFFRKLETQKDLFK